MPVACVMLLATGCSAPVSRSAPNTDSNSDVIAPGVTHRAIATGPDEGIDLIDIDLGRAAVRISVAADDVRLTNGMVTGRAYTPREWLDRTHALAAVNGGYFGADSGADRKEIVGLLVQNGRVRRAAPPISGSAGDFVRSAFGITPSGRPVIAWAATEPHAPYIARSFRSFDSQSVDKAPWGVSTAVGCGPTLVHGGKILVADREERLVSEGEQPRTFVAYDGPRDNPRHFVLGMASGIGYRDLAKFLISYFPRYDKSRAMAAMCLDGGSSSQLSYRTKDGAVKSPRDTGVSVPDAILLVPDNTAASFSHN